MLERLMRSGWWALSVGAVFGSFVSSVSLAAPPLPADLYGRLPLIEAPALSPDGTKVAFLSPSEGRRCIRIQRLFGDIGKIKMICPGEAEVRWFAWKTNTRLVAGVMGAAGSSSAPNALVPFSDLIAVDDDGSHQVELVKGRRGFWINFTLDQVIDMMWADPAHVLVKLRSESYPSPDIIQVDINTADETTVIRGRPDTVAWLSDGDGHIRYAIVNDDKKPELRFRADDNSSFEPLPNTAGLAGLAALGETFRILSSGKPGVFYSLAGGETGRGAVYLYDAAVGRIVDRVAALPDIDIGGLIGHHGKMVGYGYIDDRYHQVFTDPAWTHDQEVIAKALPDHDVYLVDRTDDGQRVLAEVVAGSLPGSIYVLSRVPGKPTGLSELGRIRPELPDDRVADVKPVTYQASDGLKIHAYLTLPPGVGKGPIPFVVLPHGGPISRDFWHFDYLAQMIATRGYGVLQPNFRGSSGYGQIFTLSGLQQWGRKMQDDVTDGTRWLIDQGLADPKRICIVGWSYGGYAALMGAIREPSLYRCVASMAGPTQLGLLDDGSGRSHHYFLAGEVGTAADNSPVALADRITAPVLLAHGRLDTIVPVIDSEAMERALRRSGKKVDSLYFDQDNHYLFKETYRIQFLRKLSQFLGENLTPVAP